MKGMNQVSMLEMPIGKWFTMTLKSEDGHVFKNVVYCSEMQKGGLAIFTYVNPDPSLDWDKVSFVDIEDYDMAPIKNFVYRYFNKLLEKVSLQDMGYSEILKRIMFSTCFDMVTDENLYGDKGLAILDYVLDEAFPRIGAKKSGLGKFECVYDAMRTYMLLDLQRYLDLYVELNGLIGYDENPCMTTEYKSFLNRSEWDEEREWCSLHRLLDMDDSPLGVNQ